jgi:hypothetical protein
MTSREGNRGWEWGSKYTTRGAVGLAVAGAGAVILFKGRHRRTAPMVTLGAGAMKVTKQLRWSREPEWPALLARHRCPSVAGFASPSASATISEGCSLAPTGTRMNCLPFDM